MAGFELIMYGRAFQVITEVSDHQHLVLTRTSSQCV